MNHSKSFNPQATARIFADMLSDTFKTSWFNLRISHLGHVLSCCYDQFIGLPTQELIIPEYKITKIAPKPSGVNYGYIGVVNHKKYMVKSGPDTDITAEPIASGLRTVISDNAKNMGWLPKEVNITPNIVVVPTYDGFMIGSEMLDSSFRTEEDNRKLRKDGSPPPEFDEYSSILVYVACRITKEGDSNPGNIGTIVHNGKHYYAMIDGAKTLGLEKRNITELGYEKLRPNAAQSYQDALAWMRVKKCATSFSSHQIVEILATRYFALETSTPEGYLSAICPERKLDDILETVLKEKAKLIEEADTAITAWYNTIDQTAWVKTFTFNTIRDVANKLELSQLTGWLSSQTTLDALPTPVQSLSTYFLWKQIKDCLVYIQNHRHSARPTAFGELPDIVWQEWRNLLDSANTAIRSYKPNLGAALAMPHRQARTSPATNATPVYVGRKEAALPQSPHYSPPTSRRGSRHTVILAKTSTTGERHAPSNEAPASLSLLSLPPSVLPGEDATPQTARLPTSNTSAETSNPSSAQGSNNVEPQRTSQEEAAATPQPAGTDNTTLNTKRIAYLKQCLRARIQDLKREASRTGHQYRAQYATFWTELPVYATSSLFSSGSFYVISAILEWDIIMAYPASALIGIGVQLWRNSVYNIEISQCSRQDVVMGTTSGLFAAMMIHAATIVSTNITLHYDVTMTSCLAITFTLAVGTTAVLCSLYTHGTLCIE